MLPLAANGVLEYFLRGVSVAHSAEWRLYGPQGGGDLHFATLRGNHSEIRARVGCGPETPETGYRTRLTLHLASSVDLMEFEKSLAVSMEE